MGTATFSRLETEKKNVQRKFKVDVTLPFRVGIALQDSFDSR